MNAQTHKAVPTFPLGWHYKSELEATDKAIEYSLKYPDQFIYMILHTSTGRFRLDYMGLSYPKLYSVCLRVAGSNYHPK